MLRSNILFLFITFVIFMAFTDAHAGCGNTAEEAFFLHVNAHQESDTQTLVKCTSKNGLYEFKKWATDVTFSNSPFKGAIEPATKAIGDEESIKKIGAQEFFKQFHTIYTKQNKQYLNKDNGTPIILGLVNEGEATHVVFRYEDHFSEFKWFKPKVFSLIKAGNEYKSYSANLFAP